VIVTPTTAQVGFMGAAPATSGSVFDYQVSLVSNATGYSATGLPAGLSLNSSTGLITGTVTTPGIYYATVSATNSGGVATSPLLIAVPPATPYAQSSNNPAVLLSSSGGNMTVQPVPDNTLLINPGKGWVEYYGPTIYTAGNIGAAYSRCAWADVEPTEGVFNWNPIDNLITAYAPYGLKIGYRIMNVDAVPQWVFQSGTNPVTQTVYPTGAVPMSVPSPYGSTISVPASWEDPVYVARLKEFISAFGAQYNGNANIAFLDIGDYGMDGEENGTFATGLSNVTPDQLQNDFFQPYFTAFPDTQLDVNTNVGGLYANVYAWAATQGAGARRDGICSFWSANGSENLVAYPHAPGIMEYAFSWANTVAAGIDPNTGLAYASPGELLMYITGGRTSYMQFQPEFYDLYPAFCQMAGNLIGYHFVIRQATIPTTVQANVQFPMSVAWLNNGVAPINNPCSVAAALLDANNNVVQKQWLTNSNPAGWMPGTTTTENYNVTFTSVPTGYRLAVGLFVNQTDANPTYRLGIQGRTVTSWYILTGTVDQVAATWTNASGGSWQTADNWTGSSVRNGIDATNDFSTLNLSSNATVTLDGNVTVGNLLFGDTTPGNNWTLNTGTGGGVLTLRTSPNAPTPGITVTNGTATINARLAGFPGQGLTKSGTGRLVLNGTNAYYGNTTINAGTLEVTTNTSLYTSWKGGTVTINTGGTLQLDGWVSFGGVPTGDINQTALDDPGSLVINGGTLAFGNTGGWGGTSPRAFSIGAGGATLMNSSANSSLWDFSLGGNTTQDTVVDNSSLTLDGLAGTFSRIDKVISGAGFLIKTGSGTWTLTGANSYTGDTTVTGGVLEIGTGASIYAGSPATATVSVGAGSTLRLNGWGYNVSGLGQLNNNPSRLIIDGGTIEFALTGGTWANRGFTIGAGGATLKASQSSGTWWLAPDADPIQNNSSLTLAGSSIGDLQMPVIGPGSLIKTGNGEWDIEGANTYTGATTVNSGILRLSSATATLGVNSAVTLANASGAVLSLSYWDPNAVEASGTGQNVGGHVSIGSLSGGGANGGYVELCSGVLTVGGDNTSTTYSGSILSSQIWRSNPNGIGALVKAGTGTLTLTGVNSYKGATTVNQGNLKVLGSLAAGSAVSVGAAGILSGTGTIGGPVTVNGTLSPGTASIGALAIANALTLNGTASLRISKTGSSLASDRVIGLSGVSYGGALVVTNIGGGTLATGDTFMLFSAGGYSGNFSSITLPALNAGLQWSLSNLAVNGSITVVQATAWSQWQALYFSAAQWTHPTVSGFTAAPAGDGIPNLPKYALGLNPFTFGVLPIVTDIETVNGKRYLRLTVTRNSLATDINTTVEVSGDISPGSWNSAGTTIEVNTATTLVVRDNIAIGAAQKRFIHLKITHP
jgi:autotransporter-associated beta strand protein